MALKNLFRKKEPSEQELRDELRGAGIMTSTSGRKQEHFGQFRFSSQRNDSNPYSSINTASSTKPYTQTSSFFTNTTRGSSYTYGSVENNRIPTTSREGYTPPVARSNSDPYGIATSWTSPTVSQQSTTYRDQHTVDLNELPTDMSNLRKKKKSTRRPPKGDDPDLNSVSRRVEVDLNEDPNDVEVQTEETMDSEEKEIRSTREEIKFVRKESLFSTKMTLNMAKQADDSATNTMKILDSQSEKLYNTEQNLMLADVQNKIANEKAKELHRLNRSIFIPAYGFNQKKSLAEQEQRIKSFNEQGKPSQEENPNNIKGNSDRLKNDISRSLSFEHGRRKPLSPRYQFENESEDDEMEQQIEDNLEQIDYFSRKLSKSASVIGQEMNSQNATLEVLEQNADIVDSNILRNTEKLNRIR
ncbi:hypothetical protein G9P44_002126 [Scheffersomyces stipitis]|nr:hypothetical protein G9P44_002126 [Scheffersomyces stipitis]